MPSLTYMVESDFRYEDYDYEAVRIEQLRLRSLPATSQQSFVINRTMMLSQILVKDILGRMKKQSVLIGIVLTFRPAAPSAKKKEYLLG